MKTRDGIVLWHLEKAADFIKKECGSSFVYYDADQEYKYPVRYLLGLRGMTSISLKNFDPAREGCFFAFGLTRSKKGVDSAIEKNFDIFDQEKFGALSVYKLNPKEEFFTNLNPKKEKPDEDRVFWKNIF